MLAVRLWHHCLVLLIRFILFSFFTFAQISSQNFPTTVGDDLSVCVGVSFGMRFGVTLCESDKRRKRTCRFFFFSVVSLVLDQLRIRNGRD